MLDFHGQEISKSYSCITPFAHFSLLVLSSLLSFLPSFLSTRVPSVLPYLLLSFMLYFHVSFFPFLYPNPLPSLLCSYPIFQSFLIVLPSFCSSERSFLPCRWFFTCDLPTPFLTRFYPFFLTCLSFLYVLTPFLTCFLTPPSGVTYLSFLLSLHNSFLCFILSYIPPFNLSLPFYFLVPCCL